MAQERTNYSKLPESGQKSEKSVGQGLFFPTARGTIKRYEIFLWIKKTCYFCIAGTERKDGLS